MKDHKLGIVILNYNTWKETEECVKSIWKYTSLSYVIYIVDNKSTDDSLEQLEILYSGIENIVVIETGENRGYSAGNNVGIKMATRDSCDIIFIVNSDVELLNDAFSYMTDTLLKKDSFMMVGPSVRNNEGREVQLARKKQTFKYFLLERHPFCKIPLLKRLGNRSYPLTNKPKEFSFCGSVAGCCFGMRANNLMEIGYLDEKVFLYYEEDILAYKMERIGRKAVINTHAKVWHKENISTNKEGGAFVQFHRWLSVLYLLKEYAEISKASQIFIALWNTLTWTALSVVSVSHRRMQKEFWKQNWRIVFHKF